MKLPAEYLQLIDKYVDDQLIDKSRLVSYLERHRTVKNEVFAYCSKIPQKALFDEAYCFLLNSEKGFLPVSRDVFMRRLPFYFYTTTNEAGKHSAPLHLAFPSIQKNTLSEDEIEQAYLDLEYMYYDLCLPREVIFGYISSQLYPPPKPRAKPGPNKTYTLSIAAPLIADSVCGDSSNLNARTVYTQWRHYLHLCNTLGWKDYTPDRFITAYNLALEASGLAPVIYHPTISYGICTHTSDRNVFIFKGNFPCDSSGAPILKWTTIKITRPESVTFSAEKSRFGELTIVASPKSMIYERGLCYDEDDNLCYDPDNHEWERIYAGPQNMTFDRSALKEFREACGLTQKAVADAIDVSVRTYQKWESGATMPDCHNLIRIMNWLGIHDVQDLIAYDES